MLSCLLCYTTRMIFQVDAVSPSLDHFLQLLSAALRAGGNANQVRGCIEQVESLLREHCSFSGLHNFFTKAERLLQTEEFYDEVHNVTIKPAERQIDEQSPFGQFLHLCTANYLGLEDDEFAKVVETFQRWIDGGDRGNGAVTVGEAGDEGRLSLALKKGDYSLARAELEGFFDRSPLDSMNRSLQETLLKNAIFHYQTKAYESARASLEESLRLSRGVNDLACVSACDRLLQRIKYEEGSSEGQTTTSPSFSLQDLWQVERSMDAGEPLIPILTGLADLLHLSQSKTNAADPDQAICAEEFADCCLWQARSWTRLGVATNRTACLAATLQERRWMEPVVREKLDLLVASVQSEALADKGRYDSALCSLFHPDWLYSLSMPSYTLWQAQVWRVLYKAASKAGSTATMDSIKAVRPEVVREVEGQTDEAWVERPTLAEPNEASFDRQDRVTRVEELLGQLNEARLLREKSGESSLALTMAANVMRWTDDAHLFQLHRQASLECAESLVGLGNATKAREMIEQFMPQLLVEQNVEQRGRAAWIYSRILLALHSHSYTEADVQAVLPWLHRAREAFIEAAALKDLSDVLYVLARLYDHVGMRQDRDDTCLQFEQVMAEWNASKSGRLAVFERVQRIVMLVGAHVVAGE